MKGLIAIVVLVLSSVVGGFTLGTMNHPKPNLMDYAQIIDCKQAVEAISICQPALHKCTETLDTTLDMLKTVYGRRAK